MAPRAAMTSSRPAGTAFDTNAASVGDTAACAAALSAEAASDPYANAERASDSIEITGINRFLAVIDDSCPQYGIELAIIDVAAVRSVGEAPQRLSAGGDSVCRTMLPSAHGIVGPQPVSDYRHVLSVAIDIAFVLDQLIAQLLLQINTPAAGLRQTIDGVHHQVKTIQVVQHRHIERRGDRAFFLVPAHVEVLVIAAAVSQAMNQRRIAVE